MLLKEQDSVSLTKSPTWLENNKQLNVAETAYALLKSTNIVKHADLILSFNDSEFKRDTEQILLGIYASTTYLGLFIKANCGMKIYNIQDVVTQYQAQYHSR